MMANKYIHIRLSIHPSIHQMSGDWIELEIANLAWIFLMSSYQIIQIGKVETYTVFELFRVNIVGLP